MLFFLATLVLYFATPSNSQSYPVFGTKRYNRAVNNVQMPVPASLVPNPSYYNSAPKYYYDQRPAYAEPTYHETYPDDNPYYYYPRQEYYGMPIFHGEYKPSPYYYAHPPSYSYYDDREIATNPMDDLHEEILQEDERERQRDLFPMGQDGWYEGAGTSQQDELTNNFLKNLIAYNRQINAQEQQQQQQQQQEQMALNQNDGRQHLDYQNDRASPIYEDEYTDYPASSEYEYVPEDREESFSAKKFTKNDSQQREKNSDDGDENERQLKYLAHQQKSQSAPAKEHNHKTASEWERAVLSKGSKQHGQHKVAYAEEETTPEYDDDTWINWDRKRSANNEMKIFPFLQKDDSVEVLDARQPTAKSVLVKAAPSRPSSIASTTSTMTTTTTTTTPTKSRQNGGIFTGQKEVVLPRPAAPFPRSMFGKPLQGAAAQSSVSNSIPESLEKSAHSMKPSNRVYDTIKQLIAMQQKFEQNPSKLQKRFVSNEESLVHELNSLKRRTA